MANFKPTKWKIIISLIVGVIFLILGIINFLFALHINVGLLTWVFPFIIIYFSWSIFQNADFKSKKMRVQVSILSGIILLLLLIYAFFNKRFEIFVWIWSLIIIILIPSIIYILYRLFQKDKKVFNVAFIVGLIGVGLYLLDWIFSTLFIIYYIPNIIPSSLYSFVLDKVSEVWFFAPVYIFYIINVIVTFIPYFIIGLIIGLIIKIIRKNPNIRIFFWGG